LEAFPNVSFGDLLRLEFLKDCDHTFSFESNRTQLTDIILGWVRSPFPRAERGASRAAGNADSIRPTARARGFLAKTT
jgi:hypothetical protein